MQPYSAIRNASIRQCFAPQSGSDHRLQHVASVRNVHFVDDAKASNPNATWYALESMPGKTILIMDSEPTWKEAYAELSESIQHKCSLVCLCGNRPTEVTDTVPCHTAICTVPDIRQAVHIAYQMAQEGDNVLYSPACSNSGMSYQSRGDMFIQAVRHL